MKYATVSTDLIHGRVLAKLNFMLGGAKNIWKPVSEQSINFAIGADGKPGTQKRDCPGERILLTHVSSLPMLELRFITAGRTRILELLSKAQGISSPKSPK